MSNRLLCRYRAAVLHETVVAIRNKVAFTTLRPMFFRVRYV